MPARPQQALLLLLLLLGILCTAQVPHVCLLHASRARAHRVLAAAGALFLQMLAAACCCCCHHTAAHPLLVRCIVALTHALRHVQGAPTLQQLDEEGDAGPGEDAPQEDFT
jgi:hypothetical protein